jgi:hypothetical protein
LGRIEVPMILVYVAGRYTASNNNERNANIRAANDVAVEVARCGYMPVVPHPPESHAAEFETVQGYEFWIAGTLALMERCDALVTVPGWEASKGATGELKRMLELGRPVANSAQELRAYYNRAAEHARGVR